MHWDESVILLGVFFILIGVLLVLIPLITRLFPEVDLGRIPWFLLYVYRRNAFVFVTSPIMILFSSVSLLLYFIRR